MRTEFVQVFMEIYRVYKKETFDFKRLYFSKVEGCGKF